LFKFNSLFILFIKPFYCILFCYFKIKQFIEEIVKDNFKENLLDELYEKAKAQESLPKEKITNVVAEIYNLFTPEQISKKIAELVRPKNLNAEVEIIYQTIEGLHKACPNNTGDWYFSGNYPTPGGNKVVNKSFMNYMEGKNVRAY